MFPPNPTRQKNRLTEKLGHPVYRLEPEEAETVALIRRVAAGKLAREELAEWLEASSEPIPEGGRFWPREEATLRGVDGVDGLLLNGDT